MGPAADTVAPCLEKLSRPGGGLMRVLMVVGGRGCGQPFASPQIYTILENT